MSKQSHSPYSRQPGALVQLFAESDAAGYSLRDRLCATLRQAIRLGALSPLQRLPSSRLLAADLQLSRVTVEAAYAQIEAEGYITRHVGKGTFVCAEVLAPATAANPRSIIMSRKRASRSADKPLISDPLLASARQNNFPATLSARGAAIIATGGCRDPLTPLPFAAGSPDLRAFPLKLWRQLTNKTLRLRGESLLGYGDPQGHIALREAVAGYLQQSRGVVCSPEQIVITTSSQQALQLLATLLIDNGSPVWIEQPGYLGARNAFASAGANLHGIAVDQHGMAPHENLPVPELIYLTPSHHYPSGASLSLARRFSLIEYARRHGSWIIEDDYDSELHYDGRPLPAMQGLDNHANVIYLGTFSKVLFPSLRLAYMVLPQALVAPVSTLRTVYDGHTSQLMQAVTAEFIEQGHFAAHLRYMRQLYQSRRDCLLAQIKQKLGDWVTPQPSAGGLQLAVHLPAGQESRLSRLAERLGVITPGLSALYLPSAASRQSAVKDGWLLGFSSLTPGEIIAAVDRLAPLGDDVYRNQD